MEINTSSLSLAERYKLMVGLVFPRPIALVSTRSGNGVANCAPYSFFNAICEDPMLVILSFSRRSDGKLKHSLGNLLRTGEFVVNLVDEAVANGMHLSSKEVDEDVSEFSEAGFTEAPCSVVAHPRIAEAPVSFECRLFKQVEIGPERDLIIGEIVYIHARDGLIDPVTRRIADERYRPVGRLYANRYCTTRQRFELPGALPEND